MAESNELVDDNSQWLLILLESLKRASQDLQTKPLYLPLDFDSPSVKTLLEMETKSNFFLSQDPDLITLGRLVTQIKTLLSELRSSQSYSIRPFLYRRLVSYQISYVALSIDREIQSWVDKNIVRDLIQMLQEYVEEDAIAREDKLRSLARFERRVSMGFDRDFQEIVLREKVFHVLESILCDTSCPLVVRENAGMAIAALARFNKNVFVGLVLMGFTIRGLVSMGTIGSLTVLMTLIKLIKGHLVNEMELDGDVPWIISKLSSEDICMRRTALDCILEMAYFGSKEVIETMFVCGLVEKLVCLQRVDSDIIIVEEVEEDSKREDKRTEDQPFSGCISRFAVQVEISEGMDKIEKKEMKLEILRRAREACISEAEAAAIVAEVLWGSSP